MLYLAKAGRWFLVLALILWAGALASLAADFLASQRPALDPAALLGDAPLITPALSGAPGLNLDLLALSATAAEESLSSAEQAGLTWLRFRIPWDVVEPSPGGFAWAECDAAFAALARHPQLRPLVVLDGSPAWARSPNDADNPLAPPHERSAFGAYAAAVAQRYGLQIAYYQIWHEPNIAPHWGARPADAIDYAGLLREAAVQIRQADSDALIVLAALAPTVERGPTNLSDPLYLDALYRAGARAWFDVVAAQAYGFDRPAGSAPADDTLNFARVALLREVMIRHGDDSTPIWATAFGWSASNTDSEGSWPAVTEAEQASYTAEAFELARSQWPWLGPLFWPAPCRPSPTAANGQAFAPCGPDGAPRLVWNVLVSAPQQPAALAPGAYAADDPALRYDPGWRVTASAADPSANGDALRFRFYGSGLALRVQGGPYWAYYTISIDGQPANALPRDDDGRAYLVLHDPEGAVRTAGVASGLPTGAHEAVIEAYGGWGQWALQGVLVSPASAAAGVALPPPGPLGGAAALASLACIAVNWPRRRELLQALAGRAAWLQARLEQLAQTHGLGWWAAALSLGLALVVSRWLALDLLIVAGLAALFVVRPDLSLPLVAAGIPFWPQPKPVLNWGITHYEIFLWLGVAATLLRGALAMAASLVRRQGGREPAKPSMATSPPAIEDLSGRRAGWHGSTFLDLPVLVFMLISLLSTLGAERRGLALHEYRAVFVLGGLLYWLVTRVPLPAARSGSTAQPAHPFWPLLDGLLVGLLAVSALALWQWASGQGRIDVEGVGRVRALYGSPNNLALVLGRCIPLALAVALFGAGQARRWAYAAAAGVMTIACVATFSKGALLLGLPAGLGLVLLGGAWRTRARWPVWLLAGSALLAAVALAWLFRTPRFAGLLDFSTGTSFFRLQLWQSAWQMALDHPLLGVGPDNFLYAYRSHYVMPAAWQELNLSHPHNILLDLWTRIGLPGLLAAGWVLAAGMWRAWYLYRTLPRSTWPVALGLLALLVVTVTHGLIDNSLFLIDLMALWLLALGLISRSLAR